MGNPSPLGIRALFLVLGWLWRPERRGTVAAGLVALAAIVGAVMVWPNWGEPTMQSREYLVTPDVINITPQPAWIHASVKTDVLRLVGGAQLDLRDPKLVENLARAFALHPWVTKVVRVGKRFPTAIDVELEYRRPVLVVKLDAHGYKDLLFLDREAVLLPSGDFASSQAKDFLRITAAGELPAGAFGAAWGSERMTGAARVAAAWQDRWQALGLYWLLGTRSASGDYIYELRPQNDAVRVVWGPPIGRESSGEPSAAEKIAALETYVRDKGRLDREGAPPLIDLRELAHRGETTAAKSRIRRR
jgi:hypothetical protein